MCYWFRQDEPWESETCKYAIRHLRIALTIDSPAFGDGGGIVRRNIGHIRIHQCFEAEQGAQ